MNPLHFISITYVAGELQNNKYFDKLRNSIYSFSIKGIGSYEYFKYDLDFGGYGGGNLLPFVIIEDIGMADELNKLIMIIESGYPYTKIVLLDSKRNGRISNIDNILFKTCNDLVGYINEYLMNWDWEMQMWDKGNIERAYSQIHRSSGSYCLSQMLQYREIRNVQIQNWSKAVLAIMAWESMSSRCGVWQHYDGGLNQYHLGIVEEIKKIDSKYLEIAKVYKSGIGMKSTSKIGNKIDNFISINRDLINELVIDLLIVNKSDVLDWSREYSKIT